MISRSYSQTLSENIFFLPVRYRFAYPVHYKLFPGDTFRFHCTYDSSTTSEPTHHGLASTDEMCQIYIGYVDSIKGLNMVYSQAAVGSDALLNPSYCGSFSRQPWNDLEQNGLGIFENSLHIQTSNGALIIEDDVPELCQLVLENEADFIASDLVWRFDIPIFTLYPTITIGFIMLVLIKLSEYALSRLRPGCYGDFADSLEDKRKVVIYAFSALFYSVILVVLLWEMTWNATATLSDSECDFVINQFDEEHSIKMAYGIPAAGNLSVIFLFIELFYRGKVRWITC